MGFKGQEWKLMLILKGVPLKSSNIQNRSTLWAGRSIYFFLFKSSASRLDYHNVYLNMRSLTQTLIRLHNRFLIKGTRGFSSEVEHYRGVVLHLGCPTESFEKFVNLQFELQVLFLLLLIIISSVPLERGWSDINFLIQILKGANPQIRTLNHAPYELR